MENIYYAAIDASADLASVFGPYETYEGSPASKGKLQMDLWNVVDKTTLDWEPVREKVRKFGLRNSTVTALMPTASTAQILGFNEAMEPFTSNIYTRSTLAGTFYVINKYLVQDLIRRNLWTEELRDEIIFREGSIQDLDLPADLKLLYRTVWEIPADVLIELAAGRGPYVDQSQSMNLWLKNASHEEVDSLLFYGWRLGLKTGIYYLRTTAAVEARKTVESNVCRRDDPTCTSCHS